MNQYYKNYKIKVQNQSSNDFSSFKYVGTTVPV